MICDSQCIGRTLADEILRMINLRNQGLMEPAWEDGGSECCDSDEVAIDSDSADKHFKYIILIR